MLPHSRRRRGSESDAFQHQYYQPVHTIEDALEAREFSRRQLLKSFCLFLLSLALIFTWAVLVWNGASLRRQSLSINQWPYRALATLHSSRDVGPHDNHTFLVIGIPSVSRAPESYVEATLRGLFETIGPKEKGLLRAVVQIGDLDQGVSARRALELASGFQAEIAQGLLEIVRVPPVEDYPALDALPQLHNDTEERTRWRSKQALDYALLMAYCQPKADYYMQLEDDVMPSANWMSHVHRMILQANAVKPDWFMIEFSRLGFIGKAFPALALDEMIGYFSANYAVLPVDILLARLIRRKPKQHFMSDQALFQHMGYFSSLYGKIQPLTDDTFTDEDEPQDIRDYYTDVTQHRGQAFSQPKPVYL